MERDLLPYPVSLNTVNTVNTVNMVNTVNTPIKRGTPTLALTLAVLVVRVRRKEDTLITRTRTTC